MDRAIKAFKAMGSNAVPFLIDVLEQTPSKFGEVVDDALYKKDLARRVPKGVAKTLPSELCPVPCGQKAAASTPRSF
jgi:hypothetical protein